MQGAELAGAESNGRVQDGSRGATATAGKGWEEEEEEEEERVITVHHHHHYHHHHHQHRVLR
ncbi:hypothetical protein E2C01_070972 [Portunus trituberculatus]|uniref:Uncharacterized protein n=1 Tax=Portunus trituberculatus TaxID=210409 RepID=A0A5B7I3M6_PORTR|nr:hypothetical protein [Portunus trituberculatus]